ncbi:hypothetical protein AX16_006503 [Volvariella volvacea WC 439]|nr:hypothetical protein AX16_006503 [Volvariella volvacea WC 439]
MAVYTLPFYGGDAGYSSLQVDGPIANDTQVQLTAGSIALSENVWFAIRTSSRGSSTEQRIVIWESIPDVVNSGGHAIVQLFTIMFFIWCLFSAYLNLTSVILVGRNVLPAVFKGSTWPRRRIRSNVQAAYQDSYSQEDNALNRVPLAQLLLLKTTLLAFLAHQLAIVRVPPPSSPDSPEPPLPTITGLDNPTVVDEPKQSLSLEWWQILLMALGCAFIVLLILMCWRRRARKKREERTKMFAEARGLNDRSRVWGWGWRLRRFFGGGSRTTPYDKGAGRGKDGYRDADEDTLEGGRYRDDPDYYVYGDDASTVMKMKTMGKGRGGGSQRTLDDGESVARKTTKSDLSQFIDAYDYSARRSTTSKKSRAQSRRIRELLDGASLYSEFTQKPRNAPDTRQPVKSSAGWGGPGDSASASKGIRPLDPLPGPGARELEKSRFSVSTIGSSWFPNRYGREGNLISVEEDVPPVPTEAQAYAMSVKPELMASIGGGAAGDSSRGGYWIQPDLTGTTALSTSSNNPFRQREYQKQQGLS